MSKCTGCNDCGHIGWSKSKGSVLITLILAFFFILPAVIYEIWRRQGLGQCAQCGSQHLKPSTQCSTSKPIEIIELIAYTATVFVVTFMIVGVYAIFTDGPESTWTARDTENQCIADGLKHYQDLGEYPTLKTGEETSTYVMHECKNMQKNKLQP